MFEALDKYMKEPNFTGFGSNAQVIGVTMAVGGSIWGISRGDSWLWKNKKTGKVDWTPLVIASAGALLQIIFSEKKA